MLCMPQKHYRDIDAVKAADKRPQGYPILSVISIMIFGQLYAGLCMKLR